MLDDWIYERGSKEESSFEAIMPIWIWAILFIFGALPPWVILIYTVINE